MSKILTGIVVAMWATNRTTNFVGEVQWHSVEPVYGILKADGTQANWNESIVRAATTDEAINFLTRRAEHLQFELDKLKAMQKFDLSG